MDIDTQQEQPKNLDIRDFIFRVENLARIQKGSFKLKPLTIFCGPNNSGKTWTMYSLYSFFDLLFQFNYRHHKTIFRRIRARRRSIQDRPTHTSEQADITPEILSEHLTRNLPNFFNDDNAFENAKFMFEIDNKMWQDYMQYVWDSRNAEYINDMLPFRTLLIPAERNGLHLFFRELNYRRTALLHHASRKNINIRELIDDVIKTRYAQPIADYIDWLNKIMREPKTSPKEFQDCAKSLEKELSGGTYNADRSTGNITFMPYKQDNIPSKRLDFHTSSSTVKSLFGLWYFLKYQAKKGDTLMIDEPELNLHPNNQRKLARLLARLVNRGLHVVISTHSDYIVREFNTLIMLNSAKPKLRKEYNYDDTEVLNNEDVIAYQFDKGVITDFKITPDDGIYAETFDNVITEMNDVNNGIYYSIQDEKNRN